MTEVELTDRQQSVLQWIANGCIAEAGVGGNVQTTALALHHRGLISLSRTRPAWTMSLTPAGERALTSPLISEAAMLESESAESVPEPSSPIELKTETPKSKRDGTDSGGERPVAHRKTKSLSKTAVLMQQLADNQNVLDVELDWYGDRKYHQLFAHAKRMGLVPEGFEVRLNQTGYGKGQVTLEPLPAWKTVVLAPVPVSPSLTKPSPAVAALKDAGISVDRVHRNRALRLLDALAKEAIRRGYTVEAPRRERSDQRSYGRHYHWDTFDMRLTIGWDSFELIIRQFERRVPHVLTAEEQRREARGQLDFTPKHDWEKTDQLRISLEGTGWVFWGSAWTDQPDRPLEEQLAQVLQEVELRHQRTIDRQNEELRRHQEQQRLREEDEEQAKRALIESHRRKELEQQLRDFELLGRLRPYIAAMKARLDQYEETESRQAAEEWIAWVEQFVDRVDPLKARLKFPKNPKPTPEALRPFMKGKDY